MNDSAIRSTSTRAPEGATGHQEAIIETKDLVKDHLSHILRKRFRALYGLNLTVRRGEAFGLLGPNGAGKTTTQKLLLGLLRPTSGSVKVLGYDAGDPRALERIGFLPENPYFYSYLTATEFLDFFGRLFNIKSSERKQRAQELLKMVSLSEAGDKPIRKFSKGMLQRLGIAQCLINDPDLIFLDEPNSGLDPVGRRDIRRIIMQLKQQGKTIFLNSHLLPDVSELCDRILILHRGRCVAEANVEDIAASGSYHDLEEYFMEAITKAESYYQSHKSEMETSATYADGAMTQLLQRAEVSSKARKNTKTTDSAEPENSSQAPVVAPDAAATANSTDATKASSPRPEESKEESAADSAADSPLERDASQSTHSEHSSSDDTIETKTTEEVSNK